MNKKKVARELLCQRWIHSYEEDTDTELVYRPATFDFPPSRGRTGFELKSDKSCVEIGIAPTDGPQKSQGTWEIEEDDHLKICINLETEHVRIMHVAFLNSNRLVIKK